MVNNVLRFRVNVGLRLMVNSLLRFVVNTRLNDSPPLLRE